MRKFLALLMVGFVYLGCAWAGGGPPGLPERNAKEMENKELKKATFAGGCFWCTEAVFQELEGVYKVTSGYIGGQVENPTYKQICTGKTGHAEAIEIVYAPKEIDFKDLLEIHFRTHDPTTLNRQGADTGTQYRSGVFYHDEEQKKLAEQAIKALDEAKIFPGPIVTEVTKASKFYPAEDYHQNFYANNPNQGYCRAVIGPKLKKFRKVFKEKLRPGAAK